MKQLAGGVTNRQLANVMALAHLVCNREKLNFNFALTDPHGGTTIGELVASALIEGAIHGAAAMAQMRQPFTRVADVKLVTL
jgi:hypothetical protein